MLELHAILLAFSRLSLNEGRIIPAVNVNTNGMTIAVTMPIRAAIRVCLMRMRAFSGCEAAQQK